jgi:hypothetical protein
MALIKRKTAAALEVAQEDLQATQTAIDGLQQEYESKKLDADPVELGRIQRGIEDQQRLL